MGLLKTILENAKLLIVLVVVVSLISTVVSSIWAVYETANLLISLFTAYKGAAYAVAGFIQLLDIYLIVAVLYIFTVALFELFIGELKLPSWLIIRNFDELKTLLANVVVLIMAVSFLKYFLERNDPLTTVLYAAAASLVSLVLISYRHHGNGNGSH